MQILFNPGSPSLAVEGRVRGEVPLAPPHLQSPPTTIILILLLNFILNFLLFDPLVHHFSHTFINCFLDETS